MSAFMLFLLVILSGALAHQGLPAGLVWPPLGRSTSPASLTPGHRAYPNEPTDFRPIVLHDFDCLPGDRCEGVKGDWEWSRKPSQVANVVIVTDPAAPTGGSNQVLRIRFPMGLRDGGSSVHFRAWDSPVNHYKKIYVSEWLRLGDRDFLNQSVGTKLWYLAYGRTNRQNQFFPMIMGGGHQRVMSAFRLRLDATEEYAPPFSKNRAQDYSGNRGMGPVLSTGRWHRLELLLELNDDGRENGVLRAWVDGKLYADHRDVTFINSAKDAVLGFYQLNFDPIYGGNSGDRRERDDFMYVDQMYVSGVPQDR